MVRVPKERGEKGLWECEAKGDCFWLGELGKGSQRRWLLLWVLRRRGTSVREVLDQDNAKYARGSNFSLMRRNLEATERGLTVPSANNNGWHLLDASYWADFFCVLYTYSFTGCSQHPVIYPELFPLCLRVHMCQW